MKVLVLLLSCILAIVGAERDWSTIIIPDPYPIPQGVIKPSNTRIVGGEESVPHSFPYQAGIFFTVAAGTAFCGGSIISKNYILTAAHCIDSATQAEVVLGAHNITNTAETTQVIITSTEFIVHPSWSRDALLNDIALVKLSEPIEFTDVIQPITLPAYGDIGNRLVNKIANVSGWGRPSDDASSISPILRDTQNPIIATWTCQLSFPMYIGTAQLCFSGHHGKNPCNGDSGGPLTIFNANGVNVQQGIVSYGSVSGCALNTPSVFTRVDRYLDWIEQNSDVTIADL